MRGKHAARVLSAITVAVIEAVALTSCVPGLALAAGVVGTGTASSCTDAAALDIALSGGGLVTFNCGGPATIDVSTGTGTKTISADTTIDGGSLITISGGNPRGRLLRERWRQVHGPEPDYRQRQKPPAPASNGARGIYSNGTLGGGIYNIGTLTVMNSTFSGNSAGGGGGIFNAGTLTVTNSTFSGDSGSYGGAIYNLRAVARHCHQHVPFPVGAPIATSGGNCSGTRYLMAATTSTTALGRFLLEPAAQPPAAARS